MNSSEQILDEFDTNLDLLKIAYKMSSTLLISITSSNSKTAIDNGYQQRF
jgi:hypothetical protein